jgi:hypothetical protein
MLFIHGLFLSSVSLKKIQCALVCTLFLLLSAGSWSNASAKETIIPIIHPLLLTNSTPKIAAFPGAQGGGADSKGGRGGFVYEVVNLNDHGEGSFRYGLTNPDFKNIPRTIVFKVGGYIHLSGHILVIDDSFITVAGQTAPGDGITLVYPSNPDDSVLEIWNTHDVIMRYIRIRKGGGPPALYLQQGSNFSIIGDCWNIIVDHCSIGWAGDENFGMWNMHPDGTIAPHAITFQWNITSENQWRRTTEDGKHTDSTGFFIGSADNPETATDISVHHNFFARNYNRNPLLKGASGDVSSNLIYNWSWWAMGVGGGMILDITDNSFKAGPVRQGGDRRPEISYMPSDGSRGRGMSRDPSFFLAGNIGYHNADPLQDAWDTMMHLTSDTWGYIDNVVTQVPHEFRRFVRRTMAHPIDRDNALTLDSLLLANGGVGTSRRLSEQGQWVHNRDVIDARVIDDYNNGTGDELVSSVDMTGGWPYYENGEYHYIAEAEFIAHPEQYPLQSGTAYTDNDHDGMADVWEEVHALNSDDASDGNLTNLSPAGYTNLEVFLGGE